MPELIGKSISQLRKLLDSKAVSAREITRASLDHIASHDQKTNAFLTITDKLALEQADDVDRIISESGKLPALAGIPVAIKDNICVEGYPTTCASKILGDFQPPYQATVIERLFAQGAICVGKANLDEFAMGSSNENTAFCVPRNPWDANKVPGGSSGGPAISVSAGYSVVGLGSDTGGSIRLPASFCGVVGMKPTYGVVSRYGLVAFASSLDQIGPFARSVEDVAITLSVIYGGDKRDSTSLHEPFRQGKFAAPSLDFALSLSDMDPQTVCKGLRVGVISDLTSVGVDADVGAAFSAAMQVIEGLGARIEEVTINHIKYALPVYYLLATAEASANLARFDGVRYGVRSKDAKDMTELYLDSRARGFGAEVKRRIMLGTYALSSGYYDAYYKKAQQVRRLIKEDFDKLFESYDVLLSPTSPTVAFGIGEKSEDPLQMYLSDIATIPANLAGLPALSLPYGFDKQGLPIGLQIMGSQLCDSLVLSVARAIECSSGLPNRLPSLT